MCFDELSEDARTLLSGMGVTSDVFQRMQQMGPFMDMGEGFIWLKPEGSCVRLMGESVKRPWSTGFTRKSIRLWRTINRPVYIQSDDPDVVNLFVKLGGHKIDEKTVKRELPNV